MGAVLRAANRASNNATNDEDKNDDNPDDPPLLAVPRNLRDDGLVAVLQPFLAGVAYGPGAVANRGPLLLVWWCAIVWVWRRGGPTIAAFTQQVDVVSFLSNRKGWEKKQTERRTTRFRFCRFSRREGNGERHVPVFLLV